MLSTSPLRAILLLLSVFVGLSVDFSCSLSDIVLDKKVGVLLLLLDIAFGGLS